MTPVHHLQQGVSVPTYRVADINDELLAQTEGGQVSRKISRGMTHPRRASVADKMQDARRSAERRISR